MSKVFDGIKWILIIVVFIAIALLIDEVLLVLGEIPVIGFVFKWLYYMRMNAM